MNDNVDEKRVLGTMDATIWSEEFMKAYNNLPRFEDETFQTEFQGWMNTWFANAIMKGYDEGRKVGYDKGYHQSMTDEGYPCKDKECRCNG